jgi:ribosomal protein S12 methylthiotransferase
VAEAEELASDGVRELILVAQDLTYYGRDLDGRPDLASLLRRLERVDGIRWIRLMYLYPMHLTDALIDTVAGSSKVLPYLDLPLQHINDDVLRRMNRGVGRAQTEALIDRLRERIDRLVLRTTMIVGFPGETEKQFDELVHFVGRCRFERLGVFAYSREPDTPAARLDGQLPEEVKQARRGRLMGLQQGIAFGWNRALTGRRMEVIIDRPVPGEDHAFVGRSYADAPEIDGVVYVTGDGLAAGDIVPCEIVAAREYDLIGVAIAEPQ